MKSLNSLIKVHKSRVIALNKDIRELADSKIRVQEELESLEEEVAAEIKNHEQGDYHYMLVNYLERAKKQRSTLNRRVKSFDQKIKALELALERQFSEMKKYDIVQQVRQQEQENFQAKQELNFIDELNIIKKPTS